ncbi:MULTISPECIES: PucR family transcriptional regulator [unclassified Peribacillus]|uniref:PucR family transcriptional regulator n=1 Tax=unclassified Peribacillus TaxID=2675266 RepID=UPI0019121D0D|nr:MULTISPECIES: PucR family transcriptional regulator [unclassified Peribacillus]MBK5444467.1 PucR family transcriptional regulator ligand-binding domain-containing protein [Peribacillus sp. TH24]MBK5498973.1 PucR family transcriptional regulator ligand-binding domain-containing protein [Peribacillus sp. TH14]
MNTSITIEEILTRRHFNQTDIIAGSSGIKRQVKWVHCMEVTQISHLLNGNELILTTGLGWKDCDSTFLSYLNQLIQCNAAGLCIEIGTRTMAIPQCAIDLADEHQFPIILFHQEVPFVEITQDIHSLIINKQYQMISNLENYSQQLNKNLLEIDHYESILKFLHNYLNVQVILIFNENDIASIPKIKKKITYQMLVEVNEEKRTLNKTVLRQPIQVLGENYAELLICSSDRELTDFDSLILDRTATALAQHLLRELYIEEKKMSEESKWLTNWIEGEYSDEAIRERLSYIDPKMQLDGGIVCICKQHPRYNKSSTKLDGTYFKIMFRTVFEQYGFQIFSMEIHQHLVFILGDNRSSEDWKGRVTSALDRIMKMDVSGRNRMSLLTIGFGKHVQKLSEIYKSYETARETLLLQDTLPEENRSFFYQDLHMYRMISLINKHGNLEETVHEYLGPVIEYDKQNNGELMPTLKTYLACNGSKQETSKQLFIVRQTLYHRLEKLEKLLGSNFMRSDQRLGIEFMIFALDYLQNSSRKTSGEYMDKYVGK